MSATTPIPNDHPAPPSPVVSTDGTHHTAGSDETKKTTASAETFASNGTKVTYVDPAADVSIASLEGRVFKVQSYVLKAQSTFFLDKLNDGPKTGPITLPFSSKVIKAWLDLAHLHNRPPRMVWSLNDPLFKLCDHLGSRGVAERALLHMNSAIEKDPWALFALASQKNNLGLAKSALRSLDTCAKDGKTPTIEGLTPGLVAGVTLPYLLGLYTAALKAGSMEKSKVVGNGSVLGYPLSPAGSPNGSVEGDQDDQIGWKAIADRFAPIFE